MGRGSTAVSWVPASLLLDELSRADRTGEARLRIATRIENMNQADGRADQKQNGVLALQNSFSPFPGSGVFVVLLTVLRQ